MENIRQKILKKYNASEKKKQCDKRYREKRAERCKQSAAIYYQKNKEAIIAQAKIRRQTKAGRESVKRYNAKRKQKYNEWYNRRYKEDIDFRLRASLRARLNSALRNYNAGKLGRTMTLLGCSMEEFKVHLESLFQLGMTWSNYGEWEVDHIKPITKFKLTEPEEQKACCHYTNLQPLWKLDNIKKTNQHNA